ncbi:MAG: DUF3048 domain-containing protein [Firmicutes bacterium HGW-Firmicutes-7]|nr:MAG: DUF3048 domain-containing protein [Firmicutes bacterium HGW-Firmicutes-7]
MIKKMWIILMLFIVVFSIASCKKEEITPIPVEEENVEEIIEEEEEVINHDNDAINPLTGLYISKEAALRRPIGIMINNLKAAMPQSGIGQADIIYETLVEGSICRLYAVFQDFDAEKIGPIRSARHYFLDFAFDFDALYVHYGQSPQAKDAFRQLNTPNLNGLSGLDSIMCFQDPARVRPHSTYTSYDGLMAGWDYAGYRKELNPELESKFTFSEEEYTPQSSVSAKVVLIPFSNYSQPWFEYDDEDNLYYRFQYDVKQIDVETKEQLKFKNIIIQFADMWVISGDSEGRLDMSLITSGNGYYISNGKAIPITWKKTSHLSPTQYYNEDGSTLLLNKGKTWIAVYPSYRENKITFE